MSETRELLKERICKMIDKVFEHHLDNIQIKDEESESIYCQRAFIDRNTPDGPCPEPQQLASFDHCPARTLTIEISYVKDESGGKE
jgi:hypothetical protein